MADDTLRLLSLNIQVGLRASAYRHYVTQAWRHVLPSRGVRATLDAIAELAGDYDVVAVQEADAGSLRSARVNQVHYLAQAAGFPHWHAAVNRNLGPFAQHCLGVLSKHPIEVRGHHPLPGRVRGRGALDVDLLGPHGPRLRLIVTHLSLGVESRRRQLAYLARLASDDARPVILAGDLNCEAAELDTHAAIRAAGLKPAPRAATFPSWRPQRGLDHFLLGPGLDLVDARALDAVRLSDHLPIAATLRWPQ